MKHEYDKKLEDYIQQQLNRLPELEAPPTLVPRVLKAIEARQHLPWWRQSIFNWPRPAQAVAFILFAMLPVAVLMVGQWGWAQFYTSALALEQVERWVRMFRGMSDVLQTLTNALALVVRSPGQTWLWAGAAIATVMYLSCVGLGTACVRIVLRKR